MFSHGNAREIFVRRQEKCRTKAEERGLNGVMVWSRGGGTWDRYAGGDYFANHYQQRCFLPDSLPRWSGRSHSVLMIPVKGKPVLLVTTLEYRKDLVAIDDVRFSNDFYQLVADTAVELGMGSGDVGIMYEDVMPWKTGRLIKEKLPGLSWIPCDDILEEMRKVKDPYELEAIRRACEIGTEAMDTIMNGVLAGKTEAEVLGPAIGELTSKGAVLYFVVTNSGPDSDAVHSIDMPGYDSVRKLENGELFKVDLILVYQGYICDFGRTTVVGGKATPRQKQAIELVAGACEAVIAAVKPGVTISQLCEVGDVYLCENGVSLSEVQDDPETLYAAFPPHWGHGIGMTWEKPWIINEDDSVLKKDMYLAVEKALYQPGFGTVTYEQNLLVTENGAEVLTKNKHIWLD